MGKEKKIIRWNATILEIALFLLVLINEIPRIYIFSDMNSLLKIFNLLQLPLYGIIVYCIITQKMEQKQFIMFVILAIILLFGYLKSGQAAFFRGLLLIFAFRNFPYKSILHCCRLAVSSVFFMSIVLWALGISDAGILRRGKIAVGYVHPNIAAQVIMIICMLYVAEKDEELKWYNYVIIEMIAIITFIITGSKNATIVLMVMPFVIQGIKMYLNKFVVGKIFKFLSEFSQSIIMFCTYLFTKILKNSLLLKKLDLIFTNRLFLNYYLVKHHQITLFGQVVELQDNSGTIYNDIQHVAGAIITCDCSYIFSLLVMGVIPTLVWMIGYIILMKKAIANKNYMIIALAILLAMYSFTETQMLEIYNNFVYFYILASCGSRNQYSLNRGE